VVVPRTREAESASGGPGSANIASKDAAVNSTRAGAGEPIPNRDPQS
jgi:hypothetical protein